MPNLKKWTKTGKAKTLDKLKQALNDLATIDKHYARKGVSLFPLMTKYGITAPPQVMWGVDDEIRSYIRDAQKAVDATPVDPERVKDAIQRVSHEVLEMIFKEEDIMLPMIAEVATPEDWLNVKREEKQIGYTLINPPMNWQPKLPEKSSGPVDIKNLRSFFVNFKEGSLNLEQLSAILDLLPFALTFVDENDKVAYFGGGAAIYPHSKNALGNSVFFLVIRRRASRWFRRFLRIFMKVNEIWLNIGLRLKKMGKTLYLRYYAVRDANNKYLGCLEVAEDITKIRDLSGEKKNIINVL